jgi:hypothetical protein
MARVGDPITYHARPSEDGLRVLCGARSCDQPVAGVVERGGRQAYRELFLLPGWSDRENKDGIWLSNEDGAWHPSKHTCARIAHGHGPGNHRAERVELNVLIKSNKPDDESAKEHVDEQGIMRRQERFVERDAGEQRWPDWLRQPPKKRYLQLGPIITVFPVTVFCCDQHRNVLDAARLDVVTDQDRARLLGLPE